MEHSHQMTGADKALKNAHMTKNKSHGFGHGIGGVKGSTGGFVLMAVLLLLMITLYMGYRVYKAKKHFSNDWLKEFDPKK